jgi:cytoskeletal protein RodZ|tara:strand:- start:1698 stop:2009 length:312 start_codon:yes stop_codon:yes gene_type:complete
MENQGKRENQVKFSSLMAFVGFLGIIFCIGWALIVGLNLRTEESGPTDTNWLPPISDSTLNDSVEIKYEEESINKTKEDTDWTHTYQDEDVMWIGGDGDTIWE